MDQVNEAKLGELLEKRRLRPLSEGERLELDALFDLEPGARALAEQLDLEEQAMQDTITSAVEHFDFDKARRAITEKLDADRAALRLQVLMAVAVVAIVLLMNWPVTSWGRIAFIAAAMGIGVLGWGWVVVRQRAIAHTISASASPEQAFDRHLRQGRNQFTFLRALMILAALGMVLLFIDSLADAHYAKAALAAAVLLILGLFVVPRFLSRSALARHERFLTGDLNRSAWMSGRDEPR